MQKKAQWMVSNRNKVLCVILFLTVICLWMMTKVEINTDMTKYLPEKSTMKQGMDIMNEQFPAVELEKTIRVMADDLTDEQKSEVYSILEEIPNVSRVDYIAGTPDYEKDNHTLYVVNTTFDYASPEEKQIQKDIKKELSGYTFEMMNDNTTVNELPFFVIAGALVILVSILFVMCGSWFEPILFLITIGIAVGINLGTNLIMGSVSNITYMIAALLQLVLSMDYSIIMMDRYRQELERYDTKEAAMAAAIENAFASVTGSSVTTFVGLLALVFMSFKIGMDLGIVLAKGVLISMICVFTVLPALILNFDNLIRKTKKPTPHFSLKKIGSVQYRFRYPVLIGFIAVFIGSIFLKGNTGIAFTLAQQDPIAEVFPKTNQIVWVYPNEEDEFVTETAEKLAAEDENILSASSYSLLLGKAMTVEELSEMIETMGSSMMGGSSFSLNPALLRTIYYRYFHEGEIEEVPKLQLMAYLMANAEELKEMAAGAEGFADTSVSDIFSGEDENMQKLLWMFYHSQNEYDESWALSVEELFGYVTETMIEDPIFAPFLNEELKASVLEYRGVLDMAVGQLKGEKYSRLIFNTTYSDESEETYTFIENLQNLAKEAGNSYLIGSPVMNAEMKATFDTEMRNITWLTVAAIFLVVAVTFRNLVVPLLLVLIVQCGVYATITIIGFQGYTIYYLALLVVQCILMGATIDYGILFANYYCSLRKTKTIEESISESYNGSLHTVLTSGMILVLVTGIIAPFFDNPTIGEICSTISKGALSAILLILIFLPGMLAVVDPLIMKKKN